MAAVEMSVNLTNDVDKLLKASEQQIANAIFAVGATAEGKAKANCPVDTGRLRNSISHKDNKTFTIIGTNVEYAPFVEEGTRHMKASHFLRRAIMENIDEYKQIIEKALK